MGISSDDEKLKLFKTEESNLSENNISSINNEKDKDKNL